jgi:hypothetical protein
MTKQDVRQILFEAKQLLSQEQTDTDAIVDHLGQLSRYAASISQAKSMALILRGRAQVDKIQNEDLTKLKNLSAKVQSEYIDGLIPEENALYEFARSLEKNFQTVIDAYRTIISFRKTELEKEIS